MIEFGPRVWDNGPVNKVISISPDIQGGEPVFSGTRVPITNHFDYLEGGDTIEEFLVDFPSVKRDQVVELLSLAEHTFTLTNIEVHEESFA